jgi:hypothetical protein
LDLFFGGRHFPQGELIDDILGRDQVGHFAERELEALEIAVALLGHGVVALQAVFVQKREKHFLRGRFRGSGANRGENEAKG